MYTSSHDSRYSIGCMDVKEIAFLVTVWPTAYGSSAVEILSTVLFGTVYKPLNKSTLLYLGLISIHDA